MNPEPNAHESELSRRDFLERSAYAAGLAGMASIPAGTILAEAAEASHRGSGLPRPRNVPIDHFVILMMENRSFDHYFGWLGGRADASTHESYPNPAGQYVSTRPASTLGTGGVQYKGCGLPDPGHGWNSGRAQLLGGFLAEGSENDEFALTYYERGELGFIHEAARKYTLYDRYFCSVLGPTWPNRFYKWSAQSGGLKRNTIAPGGNNWETIFDRALKHGLSVRYYYSDLPFAALFGGRSTPWLAPITQYYEDAAAGKLPNIAIVDPPFKDGSGGDGLSADEHPLGDVRLGQAFQADVAGAFVKSANYRRGAMFVVYDEWGGFYDHVRPPRVPDDRASADLNEDFGQMGFRIPAIAISPYSRNLRPRRRRRTRHGDWEWSRRWRVDHGRYGHESILSFISYRFGLGYLNKRHRYATNIGRSFNWWQRPEFEPPELPDPPVIVTQPCSLGGRDVQDPQQAHESDLAEIEVYADRLNQPVYEAKPHEIFTSPDAVKRGLATAP
ncbi:MAG TPA: alkaline phosphatase family protein [Thermoleophilaceae bacterium]|nr:alkaline phosphatase family protein [Thermoleophilaceae bacterium]